MNIGWYPGHMAKTKRILAEHIKLVDIVIELLDARIPFSSRNPDIDVLAGEKKRIVVLNKADLADDLENTRWKSYFTGLGLNVVMADSTRGKGMKELADLSVELMSEKVKRNLARGRVFTPCRAMVVGIPNVGKSTLINKYTGRGIAKTGDRPGVTRNKQWIKIRKDFELLDTPGILWPRFDNEETGIKLAVTGAISDDILDKETLSLKLLEMIIAIKPGALAERYGITLNNGDPAAEVHERIGAARGFRAKGGEVDKLRTSIMLLDEFRGAKISRISLESPDTAPKKGFEEATHGI